MTSQLIYLDHAAATPLDERVIMSMQPYFSEKFYNPSSPYALGVMVRRDYEEAKHRLAKCIGVQPGELIMTAGATESINLAFTAVGEGEVMTSAIEHASVLERAKLAGAHIIQPTEKGIITPERVAEHLTPRVSFVSIALANNELGTIQPIKKIAESIRAERLRRADAGETLPLYFHADGSQAAGSIDVHPAKLGLDLLTLSAGKIYGPKQVGLLWASPSVKLQPVVTGGGQERGLRSGTENVAGVIGFATALELVLEHAHFETKRLSTLRDALQAELRREIPELLVLGHPKKRLPHFLTIAVPGIDAERIIFAAEAQGLCVATGAACAANSGTRSHVLEAICLAPELADGSLRMSLGRLNDEATIERAAKILIDCIRHEQTRTAA